MWMRGMRQRSWIAVVAVGFLVAARVARAADPFVKPMAAELAMKELPGYPGVAAVVLYRERVTVDDLHVVNHYDRVKVLTKEGKKYANVELPFTSFNDEDYGVDKKLGAIVGRTIHADGTIIPFTGKPYLKTEESRGQVKRQAKVFTLPDVEVGSIIEYRYTTRYNISIVESPNWYIQGDLYVKSAHYEWYPAFGITWFSRLPPGVSVKTSVRLNPHDGVGTTNVFLLDIKDVPPIVEEEFDPPVRSYSYRVLFNYTSYKSPEEFWRVEGKEWSKRVDAFTNPNGELKAETAKIVAGASSPEEKLRKIYAVVMGLESTRFTRERDARENRADGERVKSAVDVLKLGRGTPSQLTELFVGMVRAAGMKAYVMDVPDRSIELFTPAWLSFEQFDDMIAIVSVDGKDVYLDPGWRYEPYGHLAWQHTLVSGLRQTEGGTEFAKTATETYRDNQTTRAANFVMDETGNATGKIEITYVGTAAVSWRHTALSGDDESLRQGLQKSMEEKLPKSLEVKVGAIQNLTEYEKPLTVSYSVTGTLGTMTGKRLLLPIDALTTSAAATFPHEKREQPVYFQYPELVQDAMRVVFKKGFALEAAPAADKREYQGVELYDIGVSSDAISFTTRRTHIQGETLVYPKDYATLRQFYSQLESKDKESVVLKVLPGEGASATR